MPTLCLGSFNIMSLHVGLVLAGWCCSYSTTEGENRELKFWLLTKSIDTLPISKGTFRQKCLGALFMWAVCRKVQRWVGQCLSKQGISDSLCYAVSPRAEGRTVLNVQPHSVFITLCQTQSTAAENTKLLLVAAPLPMCSTCSFMCPTYTIQMPAFSKSCCILTRH